MVTHSTHLLKDCYPRLVMKPHLSKIFQNKYKITCHLQNIVNRLRSTTAIHEIDRTVSNINCMSLSFNTLQPDTRSHHASWISDTRSHHASWISDTRSHHVSWISDTRSHHASWISNQQILVKELECKVSTYFDERVLITKIFEFNIIIKIIDSTIIISQLWLG